MLKVIVIDDEELVRSGIVMETDWNAMDCMVVGEASDGEEGLLAIEKYHPDLVICDIKMPGMTGIEMLKALREKGDDTPVIFLTAYSDFSYAQQAVHLAASEYILKPFEDGKLEEAVIRIKNRIQDERKNHNEKTSSNILNDELITKKGDKSKYVSESISFIVKNYSNPNLGIRMVAENVGISEGHLSHVFKSETDYTVNDYITRYRIKAAMKLLESFRYKIYEVAEMVGYKDITYFSTIFKKLTGMNPSDWKGQ